MRMQEGDPPQERAATMMPNRWAARHESHFRVNKSTNKHGVISDSFPEICMGGRKIDIYNHVMPRAVADHMRELAPGKGDMVKRVTSIPMLYDIEARVRMMERWPGYQQ